MPEQDKWLRVGEIAERLEVSIFLVRDLVDSGKLPSRKIGVKGSHRQVRESDVEAYRNKQGDR